MRGVGKQGKAAKPERANHFGDQECGGQAERDCEPLCTRPRAVTMPPVFRVRRQRGYVLRPCSSPRAGGVTFFHRRWLERPEQQQCIERNQDCRPRVGDDGGPQIGDAEDGKH